MTILSYNRLLQVREAFSALSRGDRIGEIAAYKTFLLSSPGTVSGGCMTWSNYSECLSSIARAASACSGGRPAEGEDCSGIKRVASQSGR